LTMQSTVLADDDAREVAAAMPALSDEMTVR
jgi:hypothetical protein